MLLKELCVCVSVKSDKWRVVNCHTRNALLFFVEVHGEWVSLLDVVGKRRMQIVCEYKLKFYDYLSHVSALLLPPDRCDVCVYAIILVYCRVIRNIWQRRLIVMIKLHRHKDLCTITHVFPVYQWLEIW